MKNATLYSFALCCFTASLLSSCYSKHLDPQPAATCDTTTVVSFSADIQPIISNNCLVCHKASVRNGDVWLEGYANVKNYTDGSLIYHVINRTSGYAQMPKGEAKLPACDISKMKRWIDNGAPNN